MKVDMNRGSPKVMVVIPTYNERDNLPTIVDLLAGLGIANLHVLVVDDNSPDGTGEVADKLAIDGPLPVGVLHRSAKDGLGGRTWPAWVNACPRGRPS